MMLTHGDVMRGDDDHVGHQLGLGRGMVVDPGRGQREFLPHHQAIRIAQAVEKIPFKRATAPHAQQVET